MEPRKEWRAGKKELPLPLLLSELSECLVAASGDESNTSQQSDGDAVAPRMQTVLLALVSNCTKTQKPKERELLSVLKLVNLAMQRLPSAFSSGDCATALTMLLHLLPLFADASVRAVHKTLLDTVCALLSLTASHNPHGYEQFVQELLLLLADVASVLEVLSAPIGLPADCEFTFSALVETAAALSSDETTGVAEERAPAHSQQQGLNPEPSQPGLAISVSCLQQCQLLASASLQVWVYCMRTTPAAIKACLAPSTVDDVCSLLLSGGFTVQTAALDSLATLHTRLDNAKPCSPMMLESTLRVLRGWVDIGPRQHALLPAWQNNLLACLEVLASGLCTGGSHAAKGFHSLVETVATLAASRAVPLDFRARLCTLLARMATGGHGLEGLHYVVEQFAEGGQGSVAICDMFGSLEKRISGRFEEYWLAANTLSSTASSRAMPSPGSPPHKKQRTAASDVVDLCSPVAQPRSPLSSWPPAATSRPQDPIDRACSEAMASVAALASRVSPSSDGGMRSDSRLLALTGLICALGRSAPSMLALLAPAVGEWAASCLLPVNSGTYQLQDVTRTMGVVDAFFAACAAQLPWQRSATTPSRSSPQQPKARDLAQLVGLTKEQLKHLALLPWNSGILDDLLPHSPGHAGLSPPKLSPTAAEGLSRRAKVAALQIQLAAYLFELADSCSAFAKGSALARASEDADARVRAAAACLVPAFVACAPRHGKALQAAVGLLQRLAGDTEDEVRVAVADSIHDLVSSQALRDDKQGAVVHACLQSQALVAAEGMQLSWQAWEGAEKAVAAGQLGLTTEELQAFAKILLLDATRPNVQVAMLRAVLRWFATAPFLDLAACKRLVSKVLKLAASPAQQVRRAVAEATSILAKAQVIWAAFGDGRAELVAEDKQALLKAECKALQEVKGLLDEEQQDAVKMALLETIAALGCRMQGSNAELLVLVVLVGRMDDQDHCIRAAAADLLAGYALRKGTDQAALVLDTPKLLEYMGRNLLPKPDLLGKVAELLEMDERELAVRILPSVLAKLTEVEDTATLEALAGKVGTPLAVLMKEYGHHVVAKYLYEGYEDFDKFMIFMEKQIGESFLAFLGNIMQRVKMEIISQAGASSEWESAYTLPDTVFARAYQMLRELSNFKHSSDDVAAFLADGDHVTRILKTYGDSLDQRQVLQKAHPPPGEIKRHQHVLRCLALLIRLTGPYVPRFLPQMMVLLTSSVRTSNPDPLKLQALHGWSTLLLALVKEAPEQLAKVVNQVVVALLEPLQEGGAVMAAAVQVLETIIIDGRVLMKAQIKALPPLPQSLPALAKINQVIAQERGKLTNSEHISLLLQSLGHHSLSVRTTALQELRDYLNAHRQWLASLLATSTSAATQDGQPQQSALLCSIIAALLKCCDPEAQSPGSLKAQQICAECLGLLSAVDPARLSLKVDPPDSLCNGIQELLVVLMSKHLVRLLRVASSLPVLDATAFAIQELLREYGRPAGGEQGRAQGSRESSPAHENTLYNMLPPDVQALVQPYLDSKYALTGGSGNATSGLVYTSTSEISFRRWLHVWLRQLVDNHASGAMLPLFHACGLVMWYDVQTCLFLLPYIIENTLAGGGGKAREEIKQEIEAVLRGVHTNKEGELCVQAIFSLLDMLKKWVGEVKAQSEESSGSAAMSSSVSKAASGRQDALSPEDLATQPVVDLIGSIPLDLLAQAAVQCGAHARALQYYEVFVREKRGGGLNPAAKSSATYTDEEVTFLQEVYGKLEEPDGLAGLVRLRNGGPRLQDQVLAAEKAGCWSEALALYEQALQNDTPGGARSCPGSQAEAESVGSGLSHAQRGHLMCLLQMGHLQGMLAQVDGWFGRAAEQARRQLAAYGVAASWRLGRWRLLEEYLACTSSGLEVLSGEVKWEVRIGELLSSIYSRDRLKTKLGLEDARRAIMAPLSAASMESYTRAYPYLVKLHMLQELSDAAVLLQEGSVGPVTGPHERQRRLRWEERLRVTQSSLAVQEPILALRRQLGGLSGADVEAGLCWLQHAKLCRGTGHYEAATTASLEALAHGVVGAPIQHAKLLWDMDQPHRAIIKLQQELQQIDAASRAPRAGTQGQPEQRQNEAQIALQLARWMAKTGQGDKLYVSGLFGRATSLSSKSEKGYFYFAKYLDSLMSDAKQRQEAARAAANDKGLDRLGGKSRVVLGADEPFMEILPQVLSNYGLSVQYGHRHIYQSLPRMLTVWFLYGNYCYTYPRAANNKDREARVEVAKVMSGLIKALPLYVWLVALPQLTSRICHPHQETQGQIQHILTRLTSAYPQQVLWALAAVSKSKVRARMDAASNIITSAKKHASNNEQDRKLYQQFAAFCDQLIRLCDMTPAQKNCKVMYASKEAKPLMRMMPLDVLVPTTRTLALSLPASGCTDNGHRPFDNAVTIHKIKDHIDVMASLQKPKKIVFIGSDGHEYAFLAKPEDDLRKDSRMMEVAGVLNRLFAKEPASRRRNLYIRRFAVTPLTEAHGLIEWVSHTRGFRYCCHEVYETDGLFSRAETNPKIKKTYETFQGKRRADLLDKVLAQFPPRMHRWFLARFPEPASWHNARLAFTRSAAVWSMVGHILGLGDRHGENILLDAHSGDCVHIDFACLFDRGLTLQVPEMVPFRLTQNIVDAFGVSGYEGAFRRVAEITLSVLRQHRDTLASVLETFVHDPLVDWTAHRHASSEEIENPQAKDAMATIQGRLTGTLLGVRSIPSLPLSTEGQAHRLIEEAIDKENLGKMYIWWMPWF